MEDKVRLELRPDSYYVETPEGAYVLSHAGSLSFTGRSIYPLIDRLAPYLNGRHTLDELTADLSLERREMVENLLLTLRDRGVVREVGDVASAEDGHNGDGSGLYDHEIRFLGYFRHSPSAALQAYQDTTTVVLGSGPLLVATAAAAVRSGLRRVRVLVTTACATDLALLAKETKRARRDPEQEIVHRLLDGTEIDADSFMPLLDDAGLVVHASDGIMAEGTRLIERLTAATGTRLVQAGLIDGEAWITPMTIGQASWTSARLRLVARGYQGREETTAKFTRTAAAVTAGRLVQGVFTSFTGVNIEAPHQLTEIDVRTFRSAAHTVVPHPFTRAAVPRTAEEFLHKVTALDTGARMAPELFSRQATACTGDRLGVVGDPAEHDFVQTPLHVCETAVSDPVGLLRAAPPPAAIGAGLDFETARHSAVMKALATYGSLMVDPRLLDCAWDEDDPGRAIDLLRTTTTPATTWAYRIVDGHVHRVDARLAFPALAGMAPPVGVAAAYSWREAVMAGMVHHCLHLTVTEIQASPRPFPRIDVNDADLDHVADRYRSMLTAIGGDVDLYDVTGSLGLPVVIGYRAGRAAACAAGESMAAALRAVLEQILLHYQSHQNRQFRYAPPPAPGLPARLRGATTRLPTDRSFDVESLADVMERRGLHPVAIPLDHDSEVHALMPYMVQVVMADAPRD
ncbi:hypothetical protein [Nonomuraea diastatica]|uniref:YcaO domain-containing protein n=1 Tax=Nonomuraea diastatica TaxID=1848329 RepID=A0A4V6PCV9_9ACTN|nr:hypothetical protein [Nonomuraea diastatica]TDD12906.1 hypothetical protein E1294_43010 [Nonomuraea diastatica]